MSDLLCSPSVQDIFFLTKPSLIRCTRVTSTGSYQFESQVAGPALSIHWNWQISLSSSLESYLSSPPSPVSLPREY